MSELSLDEVLEGKDVPEEIQEDIKGEDEQAAAAEPEKEEAKAEDVEEVKEPQKDVMVPLAAQLDEREKRQAAERELSDLRKQLEAKKEPEQPIDPVEDPAGFNAQVDNRINAALFQQELKWMKRTHDDWDEAHSWINEQLGSNVALQQRLSGSETILEDAYELYQNHKTLEQIEDAPAMEARIRAELEAKIREEMGAETKAADEKQATASKGLDKPSTVTTGTSQNIGHTGNMSLEDIIGADIRSRPK